MLIDSSYFFGDIMVAQLSSSPVRDKVNWFIDQYEPEYMEGMIGQAAYKKLKEDLLLPTLPDRWRDLLYGKTYTSGGQDYNWQGLIQLPESDATIIADDGRQSIVVGRGEQYDPEAGETTTIIPDAIVGADFVFLQRGFGPLREDEFSVAGNVLTLLGGLVFSEGDTYFYFSKSALTTTAGGVTSFRCSPIAYYVYYWIMRSEATQTTGTGEAIIDKQNAISESPKQKMVTAWNKMQRINVDLYYYLNDHRSTYPEWQWNYRNNRPEFLKPINLFGI